ncbi:MAG TPA: serine/threonine-protein kinase [Gemmataceae bacterium]|nr:serine/threonine-protein kinase [Gemmataceae bacterium]
MRTAIASIGKFDVLNTLGSGAHSKILQIYRQADRKTYALKVVEIQNSADTEFLRQAQNEFRVAQRLDHANFIKVHALQTVRDWCFRVREVHLLMDYVDGKVLDAFSRIPLHRMVQMFVKVAEGLVHMHRQAVCHADLKPNNIMFSRSGEVKIIDYGLARIEGRRRGRFLGTPEYMAPEQLMSGTVNERTDIYNFGATMYRLVTSHLPLSAADECNLPKGFRTVHKKPNPVQEYNPKAPPQLCTLIHRCLEHDPGLRPERVSEIHGVLDHLADELANRPEAQLKELEW